MATHVSPSQDTTNRFELDRLIRESGFTVYSRTSRRTLWRKDGHVYGQDEVLTLLDPDAVWEAEYVEALYWDGFER